VTQSDSDAAALARVALERFQSDIAIGVSGALVSDSEPLMDDLFITILWPREGIEHVVSRRTRHHSRGTLGAYYALDELRKTLARH
jgi:nicotinamide mononucleotide (NMN) deamidase PncC